jgi:ribosomal protein S18 acetylase RimI-like enzyme
LTKALAASAAGQRLRVKPWQGHSFIALVGPARTSRSPTPSDVLRCVDGLGSRGVTAAVTPALSPLEAAPFFRAGFTVYENLHLLARYLDGPLPSSSHRLRRGRPWHRRQVLHIDARAFEEFWQFDASALREARRATPTSRFMVSVGPDGPDGYAVTGQAGVRGYLQRLAVEPEQQGRGIGSALVHDALGWLHRRGVGVALVNTQDRNVRALALYEHLGFVRQRDGLVVLRWDRPR